MSEGMSKESPEIKKDGRKEILNSIKRRIVNPITRFYRNTNQVTLLNVLTTVLIIVTILSVIATCFLINATSEITKVSLYLDNQRQKEATISQIDKTNKLIVELENNKNILENLNNSLESFKSNNEFPIDVFHISNLEAASESIENLDEDLLNELVAYEEGFKLVIQDMDGLKKDNIEPNSAYKNDSIDRTKQNVGVLLQGGTHYGYKLNGLSDFIDKLEKHKQKLQEILNSLNNEV